MSADILVDTLQGLMLNSEDALSLVITISGNEYEVGLMYRMDGEKSAVEVSNLNGYGATSRYAIRRVSIWRPLGKISITESPFPVVAYSSLRHHFIVLDEKLTRKEQRQPIAVESIRYATIDEQQTGFVWPDEIAWRSI